MTTPITDAQVSELPISAGRAELLEEIMSTPVQDRPETADHPSRRSRPVAVLAAAAAVAAIAAVPVWLAADRDRGATPTAPGASAGARPATGFYGLLVAPGWRVEHVDGSSDGEIDYVHGKRSLEIHWRPGPSHASYLEDRADTGPAEAVTLLGEPARLFTYNASDHTVIGPVTNGHFFEVRGGGMGKDAFVALLADVSAVDAAGFAAALPDSVVTPDDVPGEVASILADVPTPEGFDPGALEVSAYQSRYQVVAEVTTAVTCSWLQEMRRAEESGDQAGVQAAVDAMAGSRHWHALRAVRSQGGWSDVVWATADEMAAGKSAAAILAEGDMCE